jgi:hypothetical protein
MPSIFDRSESAAHGKIMQAADLASPAAQFYGALFFLLAELVFLTNLATCSPSERRPFLRHFEK